jgi:hypothetical protein
MGWRWAPTRQRLKEQEKKQFLNGKKKSEAYAPDVIDVWELPIHRDQ